MPRALLAIAVPLWSGATLLLAELRVVRRPGLVDRLRPHEPGASSFESLGNGLLSVQSFRDAIGPIAGLVGERLASALGVSEPLGVRLRRVRSPLDATAFRLRQFTWSAIGAGGAALLCAGLRPPLAVALAMVLGSAALGFLVVEQQLASASARRKARLLLELPVVSEQLGMLMGAGYSLGSALNRMAGRGTGVCAEDLQDVCLRIRQGLTEVDALREWAELGDVDALTRLVAILALNRETSDLGRLVADEARAIRREVQRTIIEQIERKSEQVWIPVTVATLVPGAVLLAVPFLEALRLFSSS
jgi:Flp pilus assembly protein TadB